MKSDFLMCGIAGYVGGRQEDAQVAVARMLQSMARRGPDAEGIEGWPGTVFGHRRLSIFDLSDAGRQPMMLPDRRIGVIFNGAIYNFRELRVELERDGYQFRSNTDTEVLLHGYIAWGINRLVTKLRGMFAFAIWDDRQRKLCLVRDRLGVKPLVYAVRGDGIAFASTTRALRAGGVVDEIDPQGIAEFLDFGYITDEHTIYEGARKLPAASLLEFHNGQARIREYWSPPDPQLTGGPSFQEAVEETERLFLEAVKLRLDADVPVGALLSGGIDSSLVCWGVAHLGADISAFTIGTHGDPADESADAVETAHRLGIKHQVINLAAADLPNIDELVQAYGEPFACASALGMLRVSRAVKPAATVLLTGDGGDDVFLGYPEHRVYGMAEDLARHMPAVAARAWHVVRALTPNWRPLQRGAHLLDFASGGLGAVTSVHRRFPYYERQGMLGSRLMDAAFTQDKIPWEAESARRLLSEFLTYDRHTRFAGEYMTKVDGGAMYYALEARSPFLDQKLWEFAAKLPYEIRVRSGVLKAVLRELARKHLGERVARGRKRGFTIPVQRWLVGRWRPTVEELFRESLLEREGWVHAAPVLQELRQSAPTGFAPVQLWYLYALESWLRYERTGTQELLPVN